MAGLACRSILDHVCDPDRGTAPTLIVTDRDLMHRDATTKVNRRTDTGHSSCGRRAGVRRVDIDAHCQPTRASV